MKNKYVRMTIWLEKSQAAALKKKKRKASSFVREALVGKV